MTTNKLTLDLSDNTELKDKFASLTPGDSVTLDVTATLDESNGVQAVLSITEADVVDESSEGETTDTPAEPTSDTGDTGEGGDTGESSAANSIMATAMGKSKGKGMGMSMGSGK